MDSITEINEKLIVALENKVNILEAEVMALQNFRNKQQEVNQHLIELFRDIQRVVGYQLHNSADF